MDVDEIRARLETYVSYLRHKIDIINPPLIHTVRCVGCTLRLPPDRDAPLEREAQ